MAARIQSVRAVIFLLFFGSGISGLIYQVTWVRVFGNVFGNTVQSAAIVVAVFMLGLGVGSYVGGRWADGRYRTDANSLFRVYGWVELAIAALGLAISLTLPHLGWLSAWSSSYRLDSNGWWILTTTSHVGRVLTAAILLLPITLLMGATLTLLVRYLVRARPTVDSWAISVLYAVNTAGAAVGAFAADFWALPALGSLRTQMLAAATNAAVGVIALGMAATLAPSPSAKARLDADGDTEPDGEVSWRVTLTAIALAMSGFAAVGLEIAWLRHIGMLLGGFRAVFSLVLTVILVGIAIGSLSAAWLQRRVWWGRSPSRAARWFIVAQGLLAASTLVGAVSADVAGIETALGAANPTAGGARSGLVAEIWFNAAPILVEVAVPALLMGFGFPLANAIVQRTEAAVGRRAGVLYLANTVGAVCGSLVAGFVLLPGLGLQRSLAWLAVVAGAAAMPVFLLARRERPPVARGSWTVSPAAALAVSVLATGAALVWWQRLPAQDIILRALPPLGKDERRLAISEGLTDVIAVTDVSGRGRRLLTNGHPMSATWPLSQRYMRALAHLPLLAIEQPRTALVIGFGVGNTTHAVTLHPSVDRVEVADLSRDVLAQRHLFVEANHRVLESRRVSVFVNDGRHHLRMRPTDTFDLITLEPPPIAYAGVGALYSSEFYALARTRLRPGGFLSQWLPVYQVPGAVSLAMIRAFVDVFPEAVLLSGAGSDLMLVGTTGATVRIDPDVLQRRLRERPAVHADLARIDLATVPEIVGTFLGSAGTLQTATRGVQPVTDDRPLQEYAVRSLFAPDTAGLSAVADLAGVADWCPRCYRDGQPFGAATGLDVYLGLLRQAYTSPSSEFQRIRDLPPGMRRLLGSAYLGAVVPESAAVHNLVGVSLASRGDLEQALAAFQRALALAPNDAETHWHAGAALTARGEPAAALVHLRRATELDPRHGPAHHDLGRLLVQDNAVQEALLHLRQAVALMPDSPDAHNDLGVVLARTGYAAEAASHFRRVLELRPGDPDAVRNLAIAGEFGARRVGP